MNQERKYTILVVDDDPINIDVIAGVLKSRGYRVLQAMNGERAVSIADRGFARFGLIGRADAGNRRIRGVPPVEGAGETN